MITTQPTSTQTRAPYSPLPRTTRTLDLLVHADGSYAVNSRSQAGVVYHVNAFRRTCTCPAWAFRGACPHLVEIDAWQAGELPARTLAYAQDMLDQSRCACGRAAKGAVDETTGEAVCGHCWVERRDAARAAAARPVMDAVGPDDFCLEIDCTRLRAAGSSRCKGHILLDAFGGAR